MFSICWPLTIRWALDVFARGSVYALSGVARG